MKKILFRCPMFDQCHDYKVLTEHELQMKGEIEPLAISNATPSDDIDISSIIMSGVSGTSGCCDDILKRYTDLGGMCISHSLMRIPICFLDEEDNANQ